jgi:uncharacterized protein (TIGR02300 family)
MFRRLFGRLMAELGTKHTCFKCETKFYDLRKNPVLCPKCGADQKDAPPQPTSPVVLHAARRAKRDEFADPDVFDRNREEEDVVSEPEDPAAKRVDDDEELPLGEAPTLEGAEESDDEY